MVPSSLHNQGQATQGYGAEENPTQLRDDYFAAYRSLKLTRDADGVLVAEFHSKGGPFRFTAQIIRSLSTPFTGSPKIERIRL
jgi:hypothetical protein